MSYMSGFCMGEALGVYTFRIKLSSKLYITAFSALFILLVSVFIWAVGVLSRVVIKIYVVMTAVPFYQSVQLRFPFTRCYSRHVAIQNCFWYLENFTFTLKSNKN